LFVLRVEALVCCFTELTGGFIEPQVFDGHDGTAAAIYAKENLLSFILQDSLFPTSVEEAVKKEFLRLDRDFLEACEQDNNLHSGTTALIALLQAR
jgi:protein phosphatase 2C family protein 2/3